MPVRAGALLAIAVAVAGAAGCGGGRPAAPATPRPRGETLFVQRCGACHRLAAAGTEGVAARNLDERRLSAALVLRTLAVPPKNMPADLLSAADAQAVAAYVAANAGR
ncbi:MAG TPA: c-type cytochrome [Gaiellaceae bacterium]|nr:c-type cytochrome [Gaiellaceae bacterium]